MAELDEYLSLAFHGFGEEQGEGMQIGLDLLGVVAKSPGSDSIAATLKTFVWWLGAFIF